MSSPQDLQLLENQLLFSKDEAIGKLIKGTDEYYYYYFLKIFNEQGFKLSEQQQKQFADYGEFKTTLSQNMKLRALFLEYDSLNTKHSQKEQKNNRKILNKINKQLFNFSFDAEVPVKVRSEQSTGGLIQQINYKSEFDESSLEIEQYIKGSYSEKGFAKITLPLYCHLDLKKLSKSPLNGMKQQSNQFSIDSFPHVPFLYSHLANSKEFKKYFSKEDFRKLSLKQMEELELLNPKFLKIPEFIGELYLKKFQYNLKDLQYTKLTKEEKSEIKKDLKDVYEWTKTLPPKFKSFSDQVLFELLQLGNIKYYSQELRQMTMILIYFQCFSKIQKNHIHKPQNNRQLTVETILEAINLNGMIIISQTQIDEKLFIILGMSTNEIIDKYLEIYFEKNDDISIFESFLKAQHLKTIMARVKLYQGQELANIYDYLSSTQIEQMNSTKLITICSFNRLYFKHGDPVKIYVELKNIPSLNIKIFEFNSENYYLQKEQQLDSSVNLDGLIAFEETNFKYNTPPIQKTIKEFEFQTITKTERGVFIIEFIGNGISSRAIIKKGRLQLRETITSAGHRFQILDENFELCDGEKTGIWVDKKFHKVDQERKEVLIPFGQRDQQFNAIVVHEKFAEFTQVFIQPEQYSLKCAFLIGEEQLLMGSQAKAVIIPRLYVNGTQVGLGLLKDQQVQVTSTNDAGVPTTIPFDNVKFDDDKPIEIQFPITAKLQTITIKVSGKIIRMHQDEEKKEELLQQQHILAFNNLEGQQLFCNQYLKYDEQNGYQIYVLGKNGEPKRGLQLTINFKLKVIDFTQISIFTTDAEGRVKLGQLNNVSSITSTVQTVGDVLASQKAWPIRQNSQIQYPSKITLLPGQQISLPYNGDNTVKNNLALYQTFGINERATIQSLINLIEIKDNTLTFTLQQKGTYELLFIPDRTTIYINVVEGEKWKNSNIIKLKNQLIFDRSLEQQLSLQNINKTKIENGTKITGTVNSKQKAQVFAYATSFIFENFDAQLDQIDQLLNKNRSEQLQIDLYSSVFQSNKELSDEQKYVLNRKTQERYIGNTLEKPQFLLKRQLVRETTTQGEQLNQGGGYQNTVEQRNQPQAAGSRGQAYRSQGTKQQTILTFQDFLKYPSTLYSNIELVDSKFEFNIPSNYSTVVILVFNSSSLQFNVVPLQNDKFDTRNMSHQSTLEKDKFYSIYRNSINVEKSVPIQVQDLTSTEIKLVDSIDKLFIILKELRKAKGEDSEDGKGFQKWEFLIKWYQQTAEQKHKQYDENQCNELNLFIYFKDPAYFETYTEAYIKNKIEKSFIDYFLLHDHNVLKNYASMQRIQELNALEQALLVIHYAEIVKQPEEAKLIAQYLENLNKQNIIDQKIFKKYFDTVLGAKIKADNEQFGGMEFEMCQQQVIQQPTSQVQQIMQQRMHQPMMMQQFIPPMSATAPLMMMQQQIAMPRQELRCNMMPQYEYECLELIEKEPFTQCSTLRKIDQAYYNDKRAQFIENFKNIEKTKEYCEKHYNKGTSQEDFKKLVSLNGFFVDLAIHSVGKGVLQSEFLSSKFIYCNNNHTEMIAVLTLIGLPNEAPIQDYKQFGGKGVEITTKSPALFFMKEIKEGNAQLRQDILVAQRFFDPKARFITSENDPEMQLEKDVQEFLIDKIYGCQVIVTNCSSTKADYQVLVEIPNGAIPVNTIFYTKSYTVNCQPYTTQRIEYYFYFPKAGTYLVYPANVSRFGEVVCVAQNSVLTVVEQQSFSNLETIDDILTKGNKDDILNFLQTKNIFNRSVFKAEEIRYLLKDKEFYLRVVEIYRKRRFLDLDSLKFSIYHNDRVSMIELFSNQSIRRTLNQKFKYFKCSLFEISNIRMLEYYPLVTKRVHKLSSEAKGILNIEFRDQYINYLTYLVEKQNHSLSDKLGFIYYLLMQERINEAIQIYKTITDIGNQEEAILQYDYFTAYLDFYIGYPNFAQARKICEKYLNYPIIHWRNLFYEVVNLLVEYDGDDDENQKLKTGETQKKQQIEKAKKEETLSTTIEGEELILEYSNLQVATVQFYKIDLEILFSRNPFLNKTFEDFSFVLPISVLNVQLELAQKEGLIYKKIIKIPDELKQFNLFIQVQGASKRNSNRYFSNSLSIQVMENQGYIRVSDSQGRFLSQVYVKAYIKEKNGNESFYKDGYTDLRGRFDYASLSDANLSDALKFSILISSDGQGIISNSSLGSIIKEVNAPAQIGKFESEVKLVSKAWNTRAIQEQEKQTTLYEGFKKKYQY